MSRHERYSTRDRIYSNWHRYACADGSKMIDVDGLDYCQRCRMPLLLVEAARDVGQQKSTLVIERLAQAANVQAVCVLWTPSDDCREDPPHCRCQAKRSRDAFCDHGIVSMRTRRIYPDPTDYVDMTPTQFARWIDQQHANHEDAVCRNAVWRNVA